MTKLTDAYQTEGRLSYTAMFISLKYSGLYQEVSYQNAMIPELKIYYDKLQNQRHHTILHWLTSLLSAHSIRRVLKYTNEFVLPGDLNHIALRKWFMFHQIQQLQEKHNGLNVVFLGSGLDPLTHYLADAHQSNLVFELDSKPVIEIKQSAGFSFDRIRISHTISDLLKDYSTYSISTFPTVFVTEGFWDYSTKDQIFSMIRQLTERLYSEAYLLTTYFNFPEMNPYHAGTIKKSTASVGEKIKNPLSLNQFTDLLCTHGFEKSIHLSPEKLKNQLLSWDLGDDLIDEFHLLGFRKKKDG